jgi:gluconate 5-dehydrogenase
LRLALAQPEKEQRMTQLFDLSGRTALVTGSARGIGFALAEGLATAGASVILNGTRADTVAEAAGRLKSKGFDAQGHAFDVTDEQAVADAFAQWDKDGVRVDIVINNAGIQFRKPLVELELSDWQRVIDTNLTSAFIVSKQAARRMIARGTGGKIINIGSLTSEAGRATVGAYTAAKGGIKMLTRAMSAEWASSDIQANAIGPGYILTDMNKPLVENATFDAWVKSSNPSQRWGRPEELVGTAVYLSSAASSYVNGQIIYVDGGWLAVL